jgi:hypothetical protein
MIVERDSDCEKCKAFRSRKGKQGNNESLAKPGENAN